MVAISIAYQNILDSGQVVMLQWAQEINKRRSTPLEINDSLKKLIKTKLDCIDIVTKQEGRFRNSKYSTELNGIKQALHTLGYRLDLNISLDKPSSYTIQTIED